MEAIILAGGLGTRLRSRIRDVPKSMAEVAGKPFLQILFDRLVGQGCSSIVLSLGYLRDVIIDAYQTSYKGVPLTYAIEETPLGTGGAIRLALQQASEPSVLVLNGDTYLDVNFAAMLAAHRSVGRPITMAITQVPDVGRYGGVTTMHGRVTGFTEKGQTGPGCINAGVYVLERMFPWPENLEERFSFETDILAHHVTQLSPAAFQCDGQFLDIGIPEDLDRAQVDLKRFGL